MKQALSPAVWVLVLLAGLGMFSETVYTPSLPEIARSLKASESMVEYTLTIYLLGFALGTFFWGKLSDRVGRKPCILGGLLIYIIGCVGCYFSNSIEMLMVSRLIQAFGGSIGSVLGQAICRDSFQGPALGKAYSLIGASLSAFPAIGPVIGGLISESFGWSTIFLVLICFALFLTIIITLRLPETHLKENRKPVGIWEVAQKLFRDKKVLSFGLIVAVGAGQGFTYFAEGPFCLISLLGMTPSEYGLTFIGISAFSFAGGLFSKKLQDRLSSFTVMSYGLRIIFLGSALFCGFILLSLQIPMPTSWLIGIVLGSQAIISFGACMSTSNAMASALVDYKWCIGTASSLFGFFYYIIVSLITYGMGHLHNGTLLPMPLYFLFLSILGIGIQKTMSSNGKTTNQ